MVPPPDAESPLPVPLTVPSPPSIPPPSPCPLCSLRKCAIRHRLASRVNASQFASPGRAAPHALVVSCGQRRTGIGATHTYMCTVGAYTRHTRTRTRTRTRKRTRGMESHNASHAHAYAPCQRQRATFTQRTRIYICGRLLRRPTHTGGSCAPPQAAVAAAVAVLTRGARGRR